MNRNSDERIVKAVDRVKGVQTFLSDAVDAFKTTDSLLDAVKAAVPWADAVGDALSESLPPIKFVVTLVDGLTRKDDPEELAYVACTVAYQKALEIALAQEGAPATPPEVTSERLIAVQDALGDVDAALEDVDLPTLTYDGLASHRFVHVADEHQSRVLTQLGYDEMQRTRIFKTTHRAFERVFRSLLFHRTSMERFEPLRLHLESGAGDQIQARLALDAHAEYQRWTYEEEPLFGGEPFALQHVYVRTECGRLTWGEIRGDDGPRDDPTRRQMHGGGRSRVDAFAEDSAERTELADAVMALIKDPAFKNEPIVIQGVAGSGKSSFTLWLCAELMKQGLHPIRIPLKNVDVRNRGNLLEDLGRALPQDPDSDATHTNNPFNVADPFTEQVEVGDLKMCPYVLILDGWDEISLAANDAYKEKVQGFLDRVQREFLRNRQVPVRVLLTGRPSHEVNQSGILRRGTPVLTLRPLTRDQLVTLVDRLSTAVNDPPLSIESIVSARAWSAFSTDELRDVFNQYENDWEKLKGESSHQDETASTTLEVLGLPLLAHLAVRLFAQEDDDTDILIRNRTALYRRLTDLTCPGAAKAPGAFNDDIEGQARVSGYALRQLLWHTAAAMTIQGEESISHDELDLRLDRLAPEREWEDLVPRVEELTSQQVLSRLMISFYFKGGQTQRGCEFLHKSFREYLFAEGIVALLKEYGRRCVQLNVSLPQRQHYWKDFARDDPRNRFSRDLALRLAPHWLSVEVRSHLGALIQWEIERSASDALHSRDETAPLSMQGWCIVRDSLADLWEWWGEGVHLRPQPTRERRDWRYDTRILAQDWIDWSIAQVRGPVDIPPPPMRTTTMDAHLGDALLRLTAWVHAAIIDQVHPSPQAFTNLDSLEARTYQGERGKHGRAFRPSGESRDYFRTYVSRIQSGGHHPMRPSTLLRSELRSIDLQGTDLRGADLRGADLRGAHLRGAHLPRANLLGTDLRGADLPRANLRGANLRGAYLTRANLIGADLRGADLRGANLRGVNLRMAHLSLRRIEAAYTLFGAHLDPDVRETLEAEHPHLFEDPEA